LKINVKEQSLTIQNFKKEPLQSTTSFSNKGENDGFNQQEKEIFKEIIQTELNDMK